MQKLSISDANFGQALMTSEVLTLEPSFAHALLVSTFSTFSSPEAALLLASLCFCCLQYYDRAPFSHDSTLGNIFDEETLIG